jgi:acetyl-CoA carboxylase biotin carboxylase subunit
VTSVRDRPRETLARAPLRKVLVANRGEIAVRIIRACRDLGIETVLAYSEADASSMAVRMADRAVCIGPAPAAASYLRADAILAAASALGVDAIHPGYGFLAENAGFSAACADAGIRFVGPDARAVELMGNKMEARRLAASLDVPLIPGSTTPVSAGDAGRLADQIGYPVLLKAAAGGGGRGMRRVDDPAGLADVLAGASAEAQSAFGDGAIYVEKYLPNARHVEIQVAFDAHGAGVHLGERDCTMQRRYQKLVEEAPSPAIDPATRASMGEAALRLCREVDYRGVGTVEFLFDQDTGRYHFIEMNTRLQVEHPVTEEITRLDLVALQLRIAAGEPLPIEQADVSADGHAIEFRINAEDPAHDFRPSAGRLDRWQPPGGPGVRVDTHCEPGYAVPPYYDSLLAKLIVHGRSRDEALARSRRALAEFAVEGVATTIPFHRWLLDQPDFAASRTNTAWVEQTWSRSA